MKNSEKDLFRLGHIINLIEDFSKNLSFEEFADDLKTQNAIVRQFEIIGEASFHVSSETKTNSTEINWEKLRDLRNLLTHEYFRVDKGEVWSTIENDLPILKEQIQLLIANVEKNLNEEDT